MKTVEYELNEQTHHLCMNGAALFDCYDKFGTKGEIVDHINRPTKKSFYNTCWLLAKLSEQGEAVRRYMGEETHKPLDENYCRLMLKPVDVVDAKIKIMEAISRGFMRTEEDEEYDIGLAELEQKKTAKSRGRNTSTHRHSFLGLRRKK